MKLGASPYVRLIWVQIFLIDLNMSDASWVITPSRRGYFVVSVLFRESYWMLLYLVSLVRFLVVQKHIVSPLSVERRLTKYQCQMRLYSVKVPNVISRLQI